MYATRELYRRYFRSHAFALLVACSCYAAFAAEASVMGAISRYLIDEVLQINLSDREATAGRPAALNVVDKPALLLRPDGSVLNDPSAGTKLPREHLDQPVLLNQLPTEGSLEGQLTAKPALSAARKVQLLVLVALALIGVHLSSVLVQTVTNIKLGTVTKRVVCVIRRHIHDKLLRLQLSYHDQHQTGRLLTRAIDDVQLIEETFPSILRQCTNMVGLGVINVSLMFWIDVRLAALALLALPVHAVLYHRLGGSIHALSAENRRQYAAVCGLVHDRLANPRVVKGFGRERSELLAFYRGIRVVLVQSLKIVLQSNVLTMLCTCTSVLVAAATFGYGVVLLQRGEISLGYLLFFYTLASGLLTPIASLSQMVSNIQMLRVASERMLEVLDEPVTIVDHPRAKKISEFKDAVVMEDVGLTYSGSPRPAVSDINLTIPAGANVCLMGRSGAGKSSLAMLLLRLYDVSTGAIRIDNINIREIKTISLRRRISYVPQEPLLFSGPLSSNILYGAPNAGPKQMIAAAKAAEIHEQIEGFPQGYDTVIGENGLRLSGGQKQRISLARALVTDPDILILDDCTSALDTETETRIQKTIKTALAGKTVVMITHRVSLATNADVIVVLDKGRIVETGTHNELLERQGSYWDLIKDQLEEKMLLAIDRKKQGAASATSAA